MQSCTATLWMLRLSHQRSCTLVIVCLTKAQCLTHDGSQGGFLTLLQNTPDMHPSQKRLSARQHTRSPSGATTRPKHFSRSVHVRGVLQYKGHPQACKQGTCIDMQPCLIAQGRQKDFVDAEKSVGRKGENISAVVGYAGGPKKGA